MKKNIIKAIKILEHLIGAHYKNSEGLKELVKDWQSDSKELALTISSVHSDVAEYLQIVKELLEEKKIVK